MSEISSLLSRRGLLKGQLTRFSNFVQTAQATEDIDVLQIKLRKEKINEVWQDFETVQTSIEEIGVKLKNIELVLKIYILRVSPFARV